MESLPRPVVWTAGAILAALAVLGGFQGWRRSALDETQSAGGVLSPAVAPLPGAKTASPLADGGLGGLTEAQVREIARQEARAALRGDSSANAEGGGPPSAAGAVPHVATVPPLTSDRPSAERPAERPAEAPAETPNQPPLF